MEPMNQSEPIANRMGEVLATPHSGSQSNPVAERVAGVEIADGRANPKPSYRYLIFAGLFMLVGLSFLIFLGRERTKIAGQPIGDLDLKPLLNVENRLSNQDLTGKWVVLHFWGPWFPPCAAELEDIAKLQQKYQDSSEVAVISVSCGSTSPEKLDDLDFDTKRVMQTIDGRLPVYCDPTEYSRVQVANLLGRKGFSYPTTLLLDPKLRVVDFWVGVSGEGAIDRALTSAMNKHGVKSNP